MIVEETTTERMHPNCRCDLGLTITTDEAQELAQETEDTPPTPYTWECHWNHETGKVAWQRIEEVIEVTPKPLEETKKYNHTARRQLRLAVQRLIRSARLRQAKVQPKVCPECNVPYLGMRFPVYETTPQGEATDKVIRTVLLRCQCKPECKPKPVEADEEAEVRHLQMQRHLENANAGPMALVDLDKLQCSDEGEAEQQA